MTTHQPRSAKALLRVVSVSFCLSFLGWLHAAPAAPRSFDLPADAAEKSLKRFSEQTALEIFYPSNVVVGVRTKAVKGVMSASAALDAMLAGTGLVVVWDALTGAFSLKRATSPAPPKSPAPVSAPKASDHGNGATHARAAPPPAPVAPASPGTIRGRLLNSATGQYLLGGTVSVVGSNLTTVTEEGGNYALLGVPAGEVRVRVSFLGLETAETVVTVRPGQTRFLDFTLNRLDETAEVVKMGEFVIVTERDGAYKALQQQRTALNIKNVVSADAFGDVSEGNVGEFLKHMPGVMLDYVDADVRTASISGMDPKYTLIMMDGAPVASAGSSNISTNRAFEFEQLSIASIESVELSKTPTPDVSGSALAGVVNLRSKGAFDRRGRQIRWSARGQMNSNQLSLRRTPGPGNENTLKIHPYYSVEFSDVFLADRLGVIAGISSTETMVEQNIITFNHAPNKDPADNATEIPRVSYLQMTDAPKVTTRANYNLRLDFKFTPNLSAWSRVDYNTYQALNYRRDLVIFLNDAITDDPAIEYSLSSQTTTNATILPTAGFSFNKSGSTLTLSEGLSFLRGAFRMDLMGQLSRATNKLLDLENGFFTLVVPTLDNVGFRWTRRHRLDPAVNLVQTSGPDWRDPASYPVTPRIAKRYPHGSREERWTGKADFRYDWSRGRLPVLFKWGGDISQQIRTARVSGTLPITFVGPDGIANSEDDRWTPESYRLRNLAGGNLQDVPIPDRFKLAATYKAHPEWFTSPPPAQLLQRELSSYWKVKEQVDSVYQQTILRMTPTFSLAPGIRLERTRSLGIGPTDRGDRYAQQQVTGSPTDSVPPTDLDYVRARYGSLTTNRSNYHTWLKYLHATYRLGESLVLKASFNNSIGRPNLTNLAGNVAFDETTTPPAAIIPNPDLQPEIGRSVFASAEYYFPRGGGSFTVTAARRDFTNLIQTTTVDVPAGGSYPNAFNWDLGGYRVTSAANVGRAHLSLLELSYRQNLIFLPGLWKGLSIFANYTRLHFDDYENFRRPEHLANGGVSFDRLGFSVRWNVAWVPQHRFGAYNPGGWAGALGERIGHDAQISYRFTKSLSAFVTARNVFNRKQTNYAVSGTTLLLSNFNDYGAIWTAGIRGQF